MQVVLKTQKDINAFKDKYVQATCPLCGRSMKSVVRANRVLDHDHTNGNVRSVLCRNCNAIEGKVHNLCNRAGKCISNIKFLRNLAAYWEFYNKNPSGIIHPSFGKPKRRKRSV